MIGKTIDNTILNPDHFNKSRFHGSLTAGIISNMRYAIANHNFKYFLVMSSRDFFYRNLESFSQIEDNEESLWKIKENRSKDYSNSECTWSIFKGTKLYQHLEKNSMYISASEHESMCFGVDSCNYVINFLNNNPEIENDIVNFPHCVEEFAIQSISSNSNEGKYYCIGNGPSEVSLDQVNPLKLTHKRIR